MSAQAKKALEAFEQDLATKGFTGDVESYDDVLEFVTTKSIKWSKEDRTKYKSMVEAAKAFAVTENSPESITVDWVPDSDGQAMADMEDEEEGNAEKSYTGAELRRAILSDRKSQATKSAKVATASVPGIEYWEDRKRRGENVFASPERAHKFGLWLMSTSGAFAKFRPERREQAQKSLAGMYGAKSYGDLITKGLFSSPDSGGGALIPEEFSTEIISWQKDYAAHGEAMQWPMNSNEASFPFDTGGTSMYYPGEGEVPTESNQSFGNPRLRAKEGAILQKVGKNVMDDTPTRLGEFLATKIALDCRKGINQAMFNGTGNNGHGGIVGIDGIFTAAADDYRNVIGGGTMLAHTKDDLVELIGKLEPQYLPGAKFYCSTQAKANIFHNTQGDVGGLSATEISGRMFDTFMGYPIFPVEVMPTAEDASGDQLDVIFGDIGKACCYGDRQQIEIDVNEHRYWDTREIGIMGTVRYDINWYNVGDGTTAGGVVALWQN